LAKYSLPSAGQTSKKEQDIPIKCRCCGEEKPLTKFYKISKTLTWNTFGKRVPICTDCLTTTFRDNAEKYGVQTSFLHICALLDIPFKANTFEMAFDDIESFKIGNYIKSFNPPHFKNISFMDTLISPDIYQGLQESSVHFLKSKESEWTRQEKKNKDYVVGIVGYDPFATDGLTDSDRKYCFDLCSKYFKANENAASDGYLVQIIVAQVFSHLQLKRIDEVIMSSTSSRDLDDSVLKSLSSTKNSLVANIKAVAKENNLSLAFTEQKDSNKAFTAIMDEGIKAGYYDLELDMFDIKTSKAIENIINLSHKNIIEQLNFNDVTATEMIKEQREMILNLQKKVDELEENNRQLYNLAHGYAEKKTVKAGAK